MLKKEGKVLWKSFLSETEQYLKLIGGKLKTQRQLRSARKNQGKVYYFDGLVVDNLRCDGRIAFLNEFCV